MLLNHVYARLHGIDSDDDDLQISEVERRGVIIKDRRLYEHKRLTLNYTTYDLRRRRETISATKSVSDIMLLSRDSDETTKLISPFWYARVVGMFHVDARLRSKSNSPPTRIDFLWVRWFGRALEDDFGDDACRLERVRFVSEDDDSPQFGFVDPSRVVRAAHLVPAFRYGMTEELLPPSYLARIKQPNDIAKDWESFHVNK